jgi:ElaB/YqjD/DUF883 family membrane-anchored ribosome-binding protein
LDKISETNWKEQNTMDKHKHADENNMSTLVEDARALVTATADVAGDKVAEARKRLAAALDSGKELLGRVRDKAAEHAKAADQVVRDNPYQTVAIAFGVGAVIGFLAARRCSRGDD